MKPYGLAILCALIFLTQGPALAKKEPKETVFILDQENGQIGRLTVFAGQTGVKLRVEGTGGTIVAKAPDWKVVGFNTADRLVHETSYAAFVKDEIQSLVATSDYFAGRKLNPRPAVYAGMPALRVTAPTPEGTVGMMMPTWSGVGNKSQSRALSVSVFASQSAAVPDKVLNILKATYRLPKFGGFPLGVSFRHSDGKTACTLRTISIKKEELPASTFTYPPKTYKHAKTIATALLSSFFETTFMETP
jgi:hypothetical protein